MASLAPGVMVDGRYRVVRALDEGGMGAVLVAEHVFLRKQVALKVLKPELAADPAALERFQREARAASAIEHPNIVRVTDFGRTADGETYLVMELIQGRSLAKALAAERRLPFARVRAIMVEVLRALEAAHARDIVHRDLKPENVLLAQISDGEQVKLVDFGIAQLHEDGEARLTSTGAVMGTPLYMAPEQLRGGRDLDARADLHAVGVMLYEMLSGTLPYEGESFGAIAHAVLSGQPRPLVDIAPGVDASLSALVMKAFHPDRAQRFQSARALREALESYLPDEAPAWADPRPSRLTDLPQAKSNATAQTARAPAALDAAPGRAPSAMFEPTPEPALELDRPAAATVVSSEPPPSRRSWRVPLVVVSLLAIIGASAGVVSWRSSHPSLPSQYRVIDLPPGARVFLDGAPVGQTFSVEPGTSHRLRLEARGYATRLLVVDDRSDPVIDGRLDRAR